MAFPNSSATFTFPSASKTLLATDASNATLPTARTGLGLDQEGGGTSVINLGADPTGAVSVTSLLQAAVTAGVHAFYFPAGTYKFDSVVTMPAGRTTTIRCEPGKTTLIAGASHAANTLFFGGPEPQGPIDVEGCKFDGNMANVGVDKCFILSIGTTGNRIVGNTFTNNRAQVICGTRTNGTVIQSNRFVDVGRWWRSGGNPLTASTAITINDDAFLNAGANHVISDNIVTGIEQDFVNAGPVRNFQFNNNMVVGANQGFISINGEGQAALYLLMGSDGVTIAGNYIYGLTGNGIDVHCTNNFTITGNTSNHNGGAGIALSGANAGETTTCNPAGTVADIKQFTISGNTTLDNWQGTAGMVSLITNAPTAAGNPTLNFASTTGVVDGRYIDAPLDVTRGTTVLSHTGTTVTMSANAIGDGVSSGTTVYFLNGFPIRPGPDSGIWIGTVPLSGIFGGASNFTISGNLATDTQGTKTQSYGINVEQTTPTNYTIAGNQLAGNLNGDLVGALNRQESDEIVLTGTTSGALTVKAPAVAGTNTLTIPAGTTNFSATGGANQVVKQVSAGAALTVGQVVASEVSGLAASATTDTTNASNITSGISGAGRSTSEIPLQWGNGQVGQVAGATNYYCGGFSGATLGTTQAWCPAPFPYAGTFKGMYCKVTAAPGGAETIIPTLMLGAYGAAANTAVTCTITGAATTCNVTGQSVAVTAGQHVLLKGVSSGAAATASVGCGILFQTP